MSTRSTRSRCSSRFPHQARSRKSRTKDTLGITEWELSNGVRVVLKPTTFKQDEILFRAVSPGGTSLASDQDFVAAETASEVIGRGGLGKLSDNSLERRWPARPWASGPTSVTPMKGFAVVPRAAISRRCFSSST